MILKRSCVWKSSITGTAPELRSMQSSVKMRDKRDMVVEWLVAIHTIAMLSSSPVVFKYIVSLTALSAGAAVLDAVLRCRRWRRMVTCWLAFAAEGMATDIAMYVEVAFLSEGQTTATVFSESSMRNYFLSLVATVAT